MQASVIIPTYKGARLIPYALASLAKQSFKDFEVVIITKPSGDGTERIVDEICHDLDLQHEILIQKEGYFTRALNMGLRSAEGEILLFTDDDAIFPKDWIESHINAHAKSKNMGAVSGADIDYQMMLSMPKLSVVAKKHIVSRSHRAWQVVRTIFNPPHQLFRKYKLGIYITQAFRVAAGFSIPHRSCLSLPVRGVNMSFKRAAIGDSIFPEHYLLKIAPNNEQYFAVQLVLQGWESMYNPQIQVHHITRTGLSKSTRNNMERELVRLMLMKLLREYT